MSSASNPQFDADQLEAAADEAVAACGGDAREAVKALIVANHYLDTALKKVKAAASMGYARGKLFGGVRNPRQSGQRFRRKAAIDSDRKRPPNPNEGGHPC
jgi:hypothetical protein